MLHKHITDKNYWEDFILKSGYKTSFFQSWAWGEFEKSLGKQVTRMGFYSDDKLVAIAQIVEVDAKRGRFLHIRNGPVVNWDNENIVKELLAQLKIIGKELGVDFVRISPHVNYSNYNSEFWKKQGFVTNQMHDVDAEITWVLDLKQDLETILQNMRKNTRYYIRKAEKDGVKIIKSKNIEDLNKFYEVYEDTVKRQKWNAYNYNYLKKEFETFTKEGDISIYLAEYQGKIIAASLFIYYHGETFYHHSGTLTEFQKIPASYLLQWESIKDSREKGITKYNFFGIARDDNSKHPWAGLTFFKKGFGGEEQRWMHAQDLPIKIKYWLTYFYELYERLKRGY